MDPEIEFNPGRIPPTTENSILAKIEFNFGGRNLSKEPETVGGSPERKFNFSISILAPPRLPGGLKGESAGVCVIGNPYLTSADQETKLGKRRRTDTIQTLTINKAN